MNINETPYLYIDVRIPEKLFLCGFEAEFRCRQNLKYIYGESLFSLVIPPENLIPEDTPTLKNTPTNEEIQNEVQNTDQAL